MVNRYRIGKYNHEAEFMHYHSDGDETNPLSAVEYVFKLGGVTAYGTANPNLPLPDYTGELWGGALLTTMVGAAAESGAKVSQAAGEAQALRALRGISRGATRLGVVGGITSTGIAYRDFRINPTLGSGVRVGVQAVTTVISVPFPIVGLGITSIDLLWGDKLYNLLDTKFY